LLVASQGADTTGTLVVPGPEGIDLAGVQAIWMWDGPVGGAWKGLALVLIFDRRDLEAVRRAQVSGAWH
ncbi:MAG: hypothetical protein K2Q09_04730, partial [Phycisphaerales bacterium]|nr:hypothetical protein [Phycisphaerales bacterium]